jgi:hypothetical protein
VQRSRETTVESRASDGEVLALSLLAVMVRRSAAGLVLIAMLMSGAVPCAGWQASAQARHDCCEEGMCPDAVGKMPGHGTMSQTADQCCATSEDEGQRDSSRLVTAFFAVPPPVPVALLPHTESARPARPPLHEISAALDPTARHVLFAVFLV